MSEHQLNHNHYPYRITNGKIYYLNNPFVQLLPENILITKPIIPLLVHLTSKGINITDSPGWCNGAAKIGDLEALQWLRSRGAPWDEDTCSYAARYGHLDCLKMLRAAGHKSRSLTTVAPWDERVCSNAALGGHIEILRWARAAGAPWDDKVCSYAAMNGHIEILRWARAAGAPWNDMVCSNAANSGHIDILRWARAAGAPWNNKTFFHRESFKKHIKIFKWAYVNGYPCNDEDEEEVQQRLLTDKDINWSLQCEKRWSKGNQELSMIKNVGNKVIDVLLPKYFKRRIEDNREPLRVMIDQVVNECHKVTDDLLPTCLSNLVVTYL